MGTPPTVAARQGALSDWASRAVRRRLEIFHGRAEILDVGAGWGKYSFVLPDYPNLDACEVWEPYVTSNRLEALYRQVYTCDIVDFNWRRYDAVIMGDVLEHLTVGDAQWVTQKACMWSDLVLVVVPYEYPQGEEEGNPFERHVQDDLTPDVMHVRYEWLRLALKSPTEPTKGLYVGGTGRMGMAKGGGGKR